MNNENETNRPWPHGYKDTALAAALCFGMWLIGLIGLIAFELWVR